MDKKYTEPSYYASGRKHEPKDIIASYGLDFNLGNAVKYISRAGKKPGNTVKDDISKAIVYLGFEIENVKKDWDDEYKYANKLDMKVNQDFADYILEDWSITNEHLREALKRIFKVSSTKYNQFVYTDLGEAKNCLLRFLATYNEPEMVSDDVSTARDYISGWNDAMDDVIDYVNNSPYYPTDLVGHCRASKK